MFAATGAETLPVERTIASGTDGGKGRGIGSQTGSTLGYTLYPGKDAHRARCASLPRATRSAQNRVFLGSLRRAYHSNIIKGLQRTAQKRSLGKIKAAQEIGESGLAGRILGESRRASAVMTAASGGSLGLPKKRA